MKWDSGQNLITQKDCFLNVQYKIRFEIMALKIIAAIAVFFISIIIALILMIIWHAHLESSMFDDFVSGNAGDIEKVIIESRFGEMTINDIKSMAYLRKSFKTIRKANCSSGQMTSIYVYYKNRPRIYTEIFINGRDPDKACLWIYGSDTITYEFDLQKPFADGIRNMIDYIIR